LKKLFTFNLQINVVKIEKKIQSKNVGKVGYTIVLRSLRWAHGGREREREKVLMRVVDWGICHAWVDRGNHEDESLNLLRAAGFVTKD